MRAFPALVATAVLASAGSASAACPNEDSRPSDISVSTYAVALTCLVNETRQEWGREELVPQRNLARAAGWHARDMADEDYFAHTEPDGTRFADRLDAVHFIPDTDRWAAGENLAAGSEALGSPAAIVRGWMNSHDHRVNMLDPDFNLVGVGVVRGWPGTEEPDDSSVTITMDMGWRSFSTR